MNQSSFSPSVCKKVQFLQDPSAVVHGNVPEQTLEVFPRDINCQDSDSGVIAIHLCYEQLWVTRDMDVMLQSLPHFHTVLFSRQFCLVLFIYRSITIKPPPNLVIQKRTIRTFPYSLFAWGQLLCPETTWNPQLFRKIIKDNKDWQVFIKDRSSSLFCTVLSSSIYSCRIYFHWRQSRNNLYVRGMNRKTFQA